jgi:hypothetical protein
LANKKRKRSCLLPAPTSKPCSVPDSSIRTLTTALPPPDPDPEYACGPTGVPALDARLGGGFPRGQVSEIIGTRSSGRSSLLLSMIAAATARGELAAVVDVLDMLDVESAAAAGVALDRLLWIRGHAVSNPGLCRDHEPACRRAGDSGSGARPPGGQFRPRSRSTPEKRQPVR